MTDLEQNAGNEVVDLADELEKRILRQVLEREFTLGGVAGVCLPQNGVAVAGNDLSALEGGPDVLLDGLIRSILADLGLHFAEPEEYLLVGKAVERAS